MTTDAASNADQATVNAQLIEKIPVLNQDIIATFTPFLSQTGTNSKGVMFVVDGIETKSAGVSASAIKSVSINNDPYTAESRSPGKGRIEITTKAGTPTFHGTFNLLSATRRPMLSHRSLWGDQSSSAKSMKEISLGLSGAGARLLFWFLERGRPTTSRRSSTKPL